MAKIESADKEQMTDEELRAVREKMNGDDPGGEMSDGDDGETAGFAPKLEEVR